MQVLEENSKMLFLKNYIAAVGLNVDQGMDGPGAPQDRGTGLPVLSRFILLMYPHGSTEEIN